MTRGPTRTVARRELAERLRQRAFKLSTAAIVGVVAAIAILAGVLGGDGGAQRYTLAVDGAEATAIAAAAERTQEAFDIELDVSRADGPAAARAGVADGDYDAALTRTGLTVVGLRITLLDGTGGVIDLATAKMRISRPR